VERLGRGRHWARPSWKVAGAVSPGWGGPAEGFQDEEKGDEVAHLTFRGKRTYRRGKNDCSCLRTETAAAVVGAAARAC
jgi:hypothetical protein